MWDQLEKMFQPRGLYREVALLDELVSIRYSDCEDMETYLSRKIDAAQRLRAIDGGIPDRLLAGLIMIKLPEEFSPLIQSMSAYTGEMSTEYVKERLLAEASRQNFQQKEKALAGKFSNKKNHHGGGSPEKKERFRGTCRKCNKYGHKAADCRTRAKEHSKKVTESPKDDEGNDLEKVSSCRTSSIDTEWVIDSGASSHMSGDERNFVKIDRLEKTKSIMTASDEVLKSAGVGDVRLPFGIDGKRVVTRLTDVLFVPGLTVNLISVKQLGLKEFKTVFCSARRCEVRDKNNELRASKVPHLQRWGTLQVGFLSRRSIGLQGKRGRDL